MKLKKTAALIITSAIVLSCFGGCASGNDNNNDDGQQNTEYRENPLYDVSVTDGNSVSITKYKGTNGGQTLTIPDELYVKALNKNLKVTGIGDYAFAVAGDDDGILTDYTTDSENISQERHGFTKVVIPASVKYIGKYAFGNNANLTEVEFAGESELTSIGNGAFYNASGIQTFELADTVDNIGEFAFLGCNIGQFEITANENFTWDGEAGLLIHNIENYNQAIYASPDKTDVVIPENVVSLAYYLFYGRNNLRSVDLNGVKNIGGYAFANSGLTEITGDECVEEVNLDAFYGTPWYPDGDGDTVYVGKVLVKADKDEKNVAVPEGVVMIGAGAFEGTDVETVILPETIEVIGSNAFGGCENLQWVLIEAVQPPVINKGGFGESCTVYVKSIYVGSYNGDIIFGNSGVNVAAKPVTVTFYSEYGDYLGERTELYYSTFDEYITGENSGKTFAYFTDGDDNRVMPDELFGYKHDVTLTAHYE